MPVADGGGECDLNNLRTLCIPCHNRQTQEFMRQRRERKEALNEGHPEEPAAAGDEGPMHLVG